MQKAVGILRNGEGSIVQAAGNKTSHTSPTRKRGNCLTPSLTLRVGVTSGPAEYKVHARRGEVADEVLENRRGRLRGTALRLYARRACRCAELAPLFPHISISLPIEGVPASLGPGLGNRESGETGILEFLYPQSTISYHV
jgi:hypothetical protein